MEARLSVSLPLSYRTFVGRYGTPSTAWLLLHSIVEGQHDLDDLDRFLDLHEIVDQTLEYESGGMETGFVGHGMDGGGSLFLFRKADCVPGVDDAPIWLFDHDLVTVEQVAMSFDSWLSAYLEVGPVPADKD